MIEAILGENLDFQNKLDVSGYVLEELLEDCKKGTCKFCFKKGLKGKNMFIYKVDSAKNTI